MFVDKFKENEIQMWENLLLKNFIYGKI